MLLQVVLQLPQPELEQQYFLVILQHYAQNHRIKDKKQMRVGIIPTRIVFIDYWIEQSK